MTVVIDTPVWSLALRRQKLSPAETSWRQKLASLIRAEAAVLIGPVRQELLSGIADVRKFEAVRRHLRGFGDVTTGTSDYERAAAMNNRCRKQGVQGSPVDFLICAVAERLRATILTTDRDFQRFAKLLGVKLESHTAG